MIKTILAALLLVPAAFSAEKAPSKFYGAKPSLTAPVALAEAMGLPSKEEVLLEGRVTKVCKKKGCWLILQDAGKDVRITFKDYAFFVPKDSVDKKVRAQGLLTSEELSVKDARHFLKDEGASKEEISKVKAPVKSFTFVASGVELLD